MSYLGNKYIPVYCPPDLPWYKRDGLLTWYDQSKYEEFSKDPDNYLKNKIVVNFDMIHAQCQGDKREYSDEHYQTIVIYHATKRKKRALGGCFHSGRKNLYVEKKNSLVPLFR